jgi:hypothetical protein
VVGDVDVARAVDRHAGREREARRGADSIRASKTADVARDKLKAETR